MERRLRTACSRRPRRAARRRRATRPGAASARPRRGERADADLDDDGNVGYLGLLPGEPAKIVVSPPEPSGNSSSPGHDVRR